MFTTRISRIVQYFPFNTESGKLLRAQWPKNPGSPTLYQSLDLLPGSFCCQVTYMNGKVLPVMAAWHANKQVVALAMVALDHLLSPLSALEFALFLTLPPPQQHPPCSQSPAWNCNDQECNWNFPDRKFCWRPQCVTFDMFQMRFEFDTFHLRHLLAHSRALSLWEISSKSWVPSWSGHQQVKIRSSHVSL